MSYDISFKAKAEGVDAYVPVGACDANITWNARKIIVKSTGLKWKNCQNNGLCVDVIPKIEAGLAKTAVVMQELLDIAQTLAKKITHWKTLKVVKMKQSTHGTGG